MKKVYYLKSCSTCQRILKEWDLTSDVVLQNIKEEKMTPEQLDEMIAIAGSAEALFSRKAMKYRAMGLHEKELSEKDYHQLILDEYTFLKRPVLLLDDQIFIGNSKKVVAQAKTALG